MSMPVSVSRNASSFVAPARTPQVLPDQSQVIAMLMDQVKAMQAQLAAKPRSGFTMKVSEKGCLSVWHGSRFPTSLYASQWEHILSHADEIKAFIEANPSLARKPSP